VRQSKHQLDLGAPFGERSFLRACFGSRLAESQLKDPSITNASLLRLRLDGSLSPSRVGLLLDRAPLFYGCRVHVAGPKPGIASAGLGGVHLFGTGFFSGIPLVQGILDRFIKRGYPAAEHSVRNA
jgi:hypothetical protein